MGSVFEKREHVYVTMLCRIYRSWGMDYQTGKKRIFDPWYVSSGTDKRLSSIRYGIDIGYWAESISACAEETLFHRDVDSYAVDRTRRIHRHDLKSRKVIRLTLNNSDALRLVPYSLVDEGDVTHSAVYGNGEERDKFIKNAYDFEDSNGRFDGISYRSNQNRNLICYALFDRGIDKLKKAVLQKNFRHFSTRELANDYDALIEIIDSFPDAEIQDPSD